MKEEKVESILDTAKKMFGRYGLQKTTLDEIARMARVAKATIYNYFGSKDQVYLEVLRREIDDVIKKESASVDKVVSPADKLRTLARAKFRHMKEAINILNLDREGIDRLLPKTAAIRDSLFEREVEIIHSILNRGVKEGVFRVRDVLLAAQAIGYAMKGFELNWLVLESDKQIEDYLDGLNEIIFKGILVERPVE
ncbi:MAG: TetR/AcrR family transcriptional regulator [Deltaproteobacteria bacterium]|nr:TetR/AcrR family transcriptional regulator [Deltaproteobacteria bacterium]